MLTTAVRAGFDLFGALKVRRNRHAGVKSIVEESYRKRAALINIKEISLRINRHERKVHGKLAGR